ncbi:MAG TPA: phosphate--acyl-ACP acyltransferase, partial [Candidatus Eisenbacteria bacterium]
MGRPVKGPVIGVDAMGGDLAPRVVIEGALEALRESDASFDVLLIGDEAAINEEAARLGVRDKLPRIVHAAERVEMAEAAASSVRRKRDSSISV